LTQNEMNIYMQLFCTCTNIAVCLMHLETKTWFDCSCQRFCQSGIRK